MFKRVNNWHLSLMVVVVSVFSILLIQQYVTAQSWTNPGTLPGVTPNNTFLVNPLSEDLNIGDNDVSILGDNVTLDGSSGANALTVDGGRKICLGGTSSAQCKDAWPVVSGGIIGEGTESKVAIFAGTNMSNTTTTIKSSQVLSENTGKVTINNGALQINNTGGSYNPLHVRFTTGATTNGIYIENNNAGGRAMLIDNMNSSNDREALLIHNRGTNHSLYINDSVNSGDYSDTTPFVVDASGQVGISTSTPLHDLDIYGFGQSAEIGLYTESTGYTGTHWGIYHHNDFANGKNELTFWNGGANQAKISSDGNLWLRNGQICDINGQNCWSGASSANYWVEDASFNLSRPEANAFVLASTSTSLPSGATGASPRFVWYPNKAAIRAGEVDSTQWDNANIGDFSTAFGYNSLASGPYSSIGGGQDNIASGYDSTVGGGRANRATGDYSTVAGGKDNYAGGNYSFAGGRYMQLGSGAYNSFVWGYNNSPVSINSENSFLVFPNRPPSGSAPRFGFGIADPVTYFHVHSNDTAWVEPFVVSREGADTFFFLGIERWQATDPEMGIDIGAYSNVDAQYKNLTINRGGEGNVGIGISEPTRRLQVEGDIAVRNNSADDYYVQTDYSATGLAPTATDCDEVSEYGRMFLEQDVSGNPRFWVCHSTGWSYVDLN